MVEEKKNVPIVINFLLSVAQTVSEFFDNSIYINFLLIFA